MKEEERRALALAEASMILAARVVALAEEKQKAEGAERVRVTFVPSATSTLKIEFASKEALDHFALWLCESGEQHYWDWMEAREEEEDGDITATEFHYHGPENDQFPDARRYHEFMVDNTIRTTPGRLTKDE